MSTRADSEYCVGVESSGRGRLSVRDRQWRDGRGRGSRLGERTHSAADFGGRARLPLFVSRRLCEVVVPFAPETGGSAQTPVESLAVDERPGNLYGWAVAASAAGGLRSTGPAPRSSAAPHPTCACTGRLGGIAPQRETRVTVTYKVTGIDLGDTLFRFGNCLTMRRSRDAANTPQMYAKTRGSAIGWMNATTGTIDSLVFCEELFKSDVVLDYKICERQQRGDTTEGAVLVAALLIALPDARFGLGLSGGESSLTTSGYYRALGAQCVALRHDSEARGVLTRLFNYLRNRSYWIDDDLVHMLALLSAVCEDRDRTTPVQVLSLSTSGNHQVDAGLFHAYQLVEALLEVRDHEPWRDAVARWNASHSHQLDAAEIEFIRNVRDVSLHFKAPRAEKRLKDSQVALGFDQDRSRQAEFRRYGMQKLLREAAQAYVLARLEHDE